MISHQTANMWRSGIKILVALTLGFSFGFFLACFLVSIITTINGLTLSLSAIVPPCEEYEMQTEVSLAEALSERARVLCWILTMPENHHDRALSVKETWGPRCNTLLFMSSQNDTSLPAVGLPVREGREYLWGKTKEALKYIYKYHLHDADWFFKADDDTYTIVENLRFLLSGFDTTEPLYFGCKFKYIGNVDYVKQGYMSGGAGYVLSKEALRRFVENGISNPDVCLQEDFGAEDLEVGKCMENLGVKAVDTRDSLGRGRFFPFIPEQHLTRNYSSADFWFWEVIYHPCNEGPEWVSDTAISFHYVSPAQMHILDYFVYRMKPVGVTQKWDLHALPDTPES